jgi:hypothetical protein
LGESDELDAWRIRGESPRTTGQWPVPPAGAGRIRFTRRKGESQDSATTREADRDTLEACAPLAEKRIQPAESQLPASEPHILIGTHALLYEGAGFTRLGLAVVDEQHKFGVMQRARLRAQGTAPDVLVMTATPIPRTLTMTLLRRSRCLDAR